MELCGRKRLAPLAVGSAQSVWGSVTMSLGQPSIQRSMDRETLEAVGSRI
jgi:hypothetical protein